MEAARPNNSHTEKNPTRPGRIVRQIPNEVEDCFRAIEKLESGNAEILSAVQSYRSEGVFSPREAVLVYGVMRANHLHKPSPLLKISLRTEQHKKQMKKMTVKNLALIWPLLSVPQQKKVKVMREEQE